MSKVKLPVNAGKAGVGEVDLVDGSLRFSVPISDITRGICGDVALVYNNSPQKTRLSMGINKLYENWKLNFEQYLYEQRNIGTGIVEYYDYYDANGEKHKFYVYKTEKVNGYEIHYCEDVEGLGHSFGCWYIQTSGIWKPVWCEIVDEVRLEKVKITPSVDTQTVTIDYDLSGVTDGTEVETAIFFKDKLIAKKRVNAVRDKFSDVFDMRCDDIDFKVSLWHPSNPCLYDVVFKVYNEDKITDTVGSYFGMRKIEADEKGIRLNNSPLYQKLILAQNYWKASGYTMPDEQAAEKDIQITFDAGFNGMRIHQKIEDERFLYLCDTKGMLVWAEFPAAYEFGDEAVRRLTSEWTEALLQQYNHPCIITWVPFNESWGIPCVYDNAAQQNFTKAIYELTKTYDPFRPVIVNDGWEHTCSDIITLHDYGGNGKETAKRYENKMAGILNNEIAHGQYKYAFAKGFTYKNQPVIISEYGGAAFTGSEGWGYDGRVKDEEEFVAKYKELTEVFKAVPNVSGYCYTQLTDVYQEVNGITDMERNPKADLSKLKEINDK